MIRSGFSLPVLFWFIIFSQSSFAQSMNGWEEVGIQTFESSQFLTDQKIIVVGDAGQIRLSDDGGATWRTNNQNPQIGFQSVSFIDSLHGLIGAFTSEILKSSDGGDTWTQQSKLSAFRLSKILMVSDDTTYACGAKGAFFRSVNAGKSWDSLATGVQIYLRNMYFLNPRNGYMVGDGGVILKTTDAGNSWILLPTDSTLQLLGIDFLDSLHGAVCGQGGAMYKTSDAGKSWQKIYIDTTHELLLSSISFHTLSHLSATAIGAAFFESNDRGMTWNTVDAPKELQDLNIAWNGEFRKQRDKGCVVGYSGLILLSLDSARSWQQSASCPIRAANISDMRFFDSSRGYAVGDHNLVLWTSNAGQTWKSLTQSDDFRQLLKIYSPSPDTSIAIGWYGWLIKSFDGWKTSYQEPPPVVPNIQFTNLMEPTDLCMVNRNTGYLVGDSIIWKTTDGCKTWTATVWRGYAIPGLLERVFFVNENIGFTFGSYAVRIDTNSNNENDYGMIFRTRNGGLTWDTLDYGYRHRIHDMYFWNIQNGIIICDFGLVLKTSDGGDTWHQSYQIPNMIPGQNNLNGINFITDIVGYITADPGKIFLTTDAGESWTLDLDLKITSYNQNLSTISRIIFPDSNTVMISGYQGMIRKKIDLKKLSVIETQTSLVDKYLWITLNQNPVSNTLSCKLYWYISNGIKPTLMIYDILGRAVQNLSNEVQKSSTSWGAEINANISSLPNGVYILVLDAGGYLKSERFVVAK